MGFRLLAHSLNRERMLRSVETRAGHARGRRRKLGFVGVVFRGEAVANASVVSWTSLDWEWPASTDLYDGATY